MKKTSKPRRRPRSSKLEVRVMSPRIVWFKILKCLGGAAKLACVLAVLTAVGWGIWQGIERALYQNPDFRLQVIDLNPNPAIDETALVELAGIDLTANLFDLDVAAISQALSELPALSSAKAERHLPGTLVVRVTARQPRAWIAEAGAPASRREGGLLVDEGGVAFPCTEYQFEEAAGLPVIHLSATPEHPVVSGKKVTHPELKNAFHLLDAACSEDAEAIHRIESIHQANAWSLLLVTREGTEATFSLGDHPRQIANFRAALDHARRQNYSIATINLIPRENVPITLRDESAPPRAIPVPEPDPGEIREDRRSRDLNTLLNRG